MGVDATADDSGGAYPQACFLLDLAYRRVCGVFSGLDLARDKCPRRLAVIAPGHQDAEAAGNDGSDNGSSLGRSSWVRLDIGTLAPPVREPPLVGRQHVRAGLDWAIVGRVGGPQYLEHGLAFGDAQD